MVNESGIIPLGHRLVVLPDSVEEKTESGLVLVRETTGREEMAQVRGVVVSVGDGCWADTPSKAWCVEGDRVVFGKYAGIKIIGADKQAYRILNDLDVIGLEQNNG